MGGGVRRERGGREEGRGEGGKGGRTPDGISNEQGWRKKGRKRERKNGTHEEWKKGRM